MPSVSRGLYRWLFKRSAVLEDCADRLNHFWTVGLLLLLSCIIGWKHGYSKPMHCWCPAHFTNNMVRFSESSCWNRHMIRYNRDEEKAMKLLNVSRDWIYIQDVYDPVLVPDQPDKHSSLLERASTTVTLYQWLPLILCFQALLFKLPNIVLYIFHGFSGVSFDKIAGLTLGYENLTIQERKALGQCIARYFTRWCLMFENCLPWRQLSLLWLLVKIMYCVNVIVQLCVLNTYLSTNDPPLDNSTSYGDVIGDNIYANNATLWRESPSFPRRVLCDLKILSFSNFDYYTFQCDIPANDFNERAYMFLWVWFVFVAVVTSVSTAIWLVRTLVPFMRKRYLVRALESSDYLDLNGVTSKDLDEFCGIIGEDGVMVLKLTAANSSELLVSDVVCSMWKQKFGADRKGKADGSGAPEVVVPEMITGLEEKKCN